ncbi:MAG: hypothetical protein IJM54_05975 [Thermoguttaceae bacterium]|nr:hypothetical protein [Thermoguttaceae bacterium]
MMRRFPVRAKRSGVTLLELLVVASVMLTLAAVSVPAIKPMMESQQTSNAASAVSTYLNRARARAMTTGRPCGVTFEFFEGTYVEGDPELGDYGSACVVLRQVEVPPYYTGLDSGANVTVQADVDGDGFVDDEFVADANSPYYGAPIRPLVANDPYWANFVANENDPSIQFNNCGPFYPIYNNAYIVKLPGLELPSRLNVLFKVKRDPRPTMTAPIGLTQGAVVDLEFSGWGEAELDLFALGADVTVMFSPSGEVEYVQDGFGTHVPTETLYFLIGRWDRLAVLGYDVDAYGDDVTLTEDGLWNYEDGSNFWVTINPRTGLVSTVEVNPPVNYTANDAFGPIEESREFGRVSKRNLGGH